MPKKKPHGKHKKLVYALNNMVVLECFDHDTGESYFTTMNQKLLMPHPLTGLYMNVHRHYKDQKVAIMVAKRVARGEIPPHYSPSMKRDIQYLLGEKVGGG